MFEGFGCRDRDLNSAINILKKGLDLAQNQVVGVDRPELTPGRGWRRGERELVAKILVSNPCFMEFLLATSMG
jgi:transposase